MSALFRAFSFDDVARILVTGASGFIGSAVIRHALASGHDVAGLVRSSGRLPPGAVEIPGDLASPPWEDIARFSPERVVHSAWISTPGVYLESPENEAHVDWSLRLACGLAERGVRRLLVLGTCIEYQTLQGVCSEDLTPIRPSSTYARAKARLHENLNRDLAGTGVGLSWGRVFYPYGEGEHPARLCSSLVARFRRGETAELRTPDSAKDYIHIDDLAAAILTVVTSDSTGAVNLGTGEGVKVRGIAERIAASMGCPHLLRLPAVPAPDPVGDVVADVTRLRSLGWEPKVTLESGLRRLVKHASL